VMAPKAASRLERLRRGARLIDTGEIPDYNLSAQRFMETYHGLRTPPTEGENENPDDLFAATRVARLDVHTRSINPNIQVITPDRTTSGEAFTVAVIVKNPGKVATPKLQLGLDTPDGFFDGYYGDDDETDKTDDAVGAIVMPEQVDLELAPGETRRLEFRVLPNNHGILGLYASVQCAEDRYDCKAPQVLTGSGTFDATEIVVEPPVVAERL